MKKNKLNKIILVIVGICILLPILNLIIWAFTERWAWPDLLPQTYSLRAIKEITFFSSCHIICNNWTYDIKGICTL